MCHYPYGGGLLWRSKALCIKLHLFKSMFTALSFQDWVRWEIHAVGLGESIESKQGQRKASKTLLSFQLSTPPAKFCGPIPAYRDMDLQLSRLIDKFQNLSLSLSLSLSLRLSLSLSLSTSLSLSLYVPLGLVGFPLLPPYSLVCSRRPGSCPAFRFISQKGPCRIWKL